MRTPWTLFAVFALSGCNLVPTEQSSTIEQKQRESIATSTTADVVRSTHMVPPEVTISTTAKDGTVMKVTQPAMIDEHVSASTSANESSDSSASGARSWSSSVPWGVQLILAAIGLSMVLGVGWVLLRSSRALKAAWSTADEFAARGIDKVRAMAQAETDPARSTLLNSIVAGLEKDRADLNRD